MTATGVDTNAIRLLLFCNPGIMSQHTYRAALSSGLMRRIPRDTAEVPMLRELLCRIGVKRKARMAHRLVKCPGRAGILCRSLPPAYRLLSRLHAEGAPRELTARDGRRVSLEH